MIVGEFKESSYGDEVIGNLKVAGRITGVLEPQNDSDVATKAYVDDNSGVGSVPDATASSKGKIQLGGELAGVGSTAASPVLKNVSRVFNVKDYGAVGDGVTGDATAINNAITAANAAGGGIVDFPKGTYLANARIVPKSNVTLRGIGNGTVIKRSANDQIIVLIDGDLDWFTLDSIRFVGPVNEFPTTPKRTRTTDGNGASFAVYLRGDQDPGTPGAGSISNFTMRNCTIENHTELPILIAGVTGVVRVVDNNFINNKDPGFIFNDEVIFNGNHSSMSADNGVSLSRSNKKVVCVGNTFENIAYQGIFCAGFDIDATANLANIGPTNFTITGNTVKNVGLNCIFLDAAPGIGVVSGNVCDQGYYRGPAGVGSATDINSTGVYVGGYPFPYSSPTAFAEDINITGNVLKRCARAGVEVWAAKRINIDSNLIVDIGTQYLANGSTAIASSEVTSNVGILIRSANVTDVTVRNNTMIDSRGTPYMNYGIVPYTSIPTSYVYQHNTMINCRNAHNLVNYDVNAIYAMKGINDFHANRVITVTDNAGAAVNFLNVQGNTTGQPVAIAADSFSETNVPFTIRSKGNGTVALRAQTDTTTAIQFRRADNVSANSVMNIDQTNARIGVNTIAPASDLHVNGTARATDLLLTNPLAVAYGGTGQANLTSLALTTPKITNGINDANGNRTITITPTASAVNYVTMQNSATGQNVAIRSAGSDTDVGLTFTSQGQGTIVFKPSTDTVIASQWRKADNSTVILNIDSTNARVGVGTATPADALDVAGTTRTIHLLGTGSTPSTAAGTAAGTSPTIVITGKDTAGKIVLDVGGTPATSASAVDVTFGTTFANAPYVSLTPGNALTAAKVATVFVTSTTTGFSINVGGTALTASEQMIWFYHVIG